LLVDVVDAECIAEVVADWTRIPVGRVLESEQDKLLHLEERISEQLIGQSEAVHAVCTAIRRARMGAKELHRPVGAFLFIGPSGVGKSELARVIASVMFDDEKSLIRLDMSEYMEKHSVSRIIGAPPGYVGYDESGQLCEQVRKRPYSVVLFDEIEKAHQDVLNILLQMLDRGVLTDNHGRETSFRNTIIVLTSNVGSSVIHDAYRKHPDLQSNETEYAAMRKQVQQNIQQTFRPELLNRLDDQILFTALSAQQVCVTMYCALCNMFIVVSNHRYIIEQACHESNSQCSYE